MDVMKLGSPWKPQPSSLDFQNPLVCKYVLYTEAPVLKVLEKAGERGAKGGDNGTGPEIHARCVWPRSALVLKREHDEQEVGSPLKYPHCKWPRTGKFPTSSSSSSEFVAVSAAKEGDSNTNGSARCQEVIESRGLNSSPSSGIGAHCAWPKVVQSKEDSVSEMARGPSCPWPRQTRAVKTQPSGDNSHLEIDQSLHELVLNSSPETVLEEDTKDLPRGLMKFSGICVNGSSFHHSPVVRQFPHSCVNGDAETRTSDSSAIEKPLGARCEWPRGTATVGGHSASLTKPQFSGSGMNGASLRNESPASSVDLLSADGTSSEKVLEKSDHSPVISSGGEERPVVARCEWPRGKAYSDAGGKKLEHETKLLADAICPFPRCEFPRNVSDVSTASNSLAIPSAMPLPRCQWPRMITAGEKPSNSPTSPDTSGIRNGSLHSATGNGACSSSSSSSSISVHEKDDSEGVMPLSRCEWPRKTTATSLDTSGESNGIDPSFPSSSSSLISLSVDDGEASEAASKSWTIPIATPLPRCQWPRMITAGEKPLNAPTSPETSGISNGSAHSATGNEECSSSSSFSSSVSIHEKDSSERVIPLPRCEWPRKTTATSLDTSGLLNESNGNDSSFPSSSTSSTSVSVDEGDACVAVIPGPRCEWPRKEPAPKKSLNKPTTLEFPNDLQANNGSVHSAIRTDSPSSSSPSAPLAKDLLVSSTFASSQPTSKALSSQLESAAVMAGARCPWPRSLANASDNSVAEQVQNGCASHHQKQSQNLQTDEDQVIREAHGTISGARCPWPRIAVNAADISREADLQNGSALHHQKDSESFRVVDAESSTNGGARCPWPRNSVTLKPLSSDGSALSHGESHPQQSKEEKMMEAQEVGTTPGPRCSWPPKHAGSQLPSNAKPSLLADSVARSKEDSESDPSSSLPRRRIAYGVGLSLMKAFLLAQGGSALASPSDLLGFATGLSKASPVMKLEFDSPSPGNPSQECSQDVLVSRRRLVDPISKLLTTV